MYLLETRIGSAFCASTLVKHSVNIFGVTETFLINSTPSSLVTIREYTFYRRNRATGIGGGVGIYISDNTPHVRRTDLE